MNTTLTNAEKIRRLPWLIANSATNSIFCIFTVFGAPFILFLDELGLPKTKIGFLLSLLPFCGILALFAASAIARAGLKRTFIIFFGLRKITIALLLLTPVILSHFGLNIAFVFVACILLIFAVCRAIAETAGYPWSQELIPASIRGKFAAINNAVVTIVSCAAVSAASYVIGNFMFMGLNRFMILIVAGVFFGILSIFCGFFMPGGAPVRDGRTGGANFKQTMNVLHDKKFVFFIGGIGMVTAAISFLSFVPLYMKEQVGLSDRIIVLLQMGTMIGGLLAGYLWGWAADRYGSKPVTISSLHMMALLPVCWMLIPKHNPMSSLIAMSISSLYGALSIGLFIGSDRLLFVGVVPPEKKTVYMAVFYAWIGIIGGCGQLIAGRILDFCHGISGRFFIFTIDPYTPAFIASLLLMLTGAFLLKQVEADSTMPAGKFVAMFFRGNPLMAMQSLLRYNLVKEEKTRVSTTERLGQSKSPLNVNELLDALSDPSFNVRYEAIISIARTRRDEKLIIALIGILNGSNPDLSTAAAWALGRIGDKKAIEPLREALTSGYPLLQARSARALAMLGDIDSVPLLLDHFRNEKDEGLRVAYASALGTFRTLEITRDLLTFLRKNQDNDVRKELAFALARVVGNEHSFIRLLRHVVLEAGTPISQAMVSIKKKIKKIHMGIPSIVEFTDDCVQAFAENDMERGAGLLGSLIAGLPLEKFEEHLAVILRECAECLKKFRAARIEYILLSIHTLNTGLRLLQKTHDSSKHASE